MKRNTLITVIALAVLLVALVFSAGCEELGETACDKMSDKDRDHCIQKLAVTSRNASLCEKIDGAGPATKCLALIAKDTGILVGCEKMEDEKWYRDPQAYHYEDCMMLVAISAKSPDVCKGLGNYYGQATDLNPGLYVTRENCLKNIQCGESGQSACRGKTGNALTPEGDPRAYYCGNVYYPTLVTCP